MKIPSVQTVGLGSMLWIILPRLARPLLLLAVALTLVSPCAGAPFTFEVTGSLATDRDMHTATLLPNGQVLVAGGLAGLEPYLASAELYDPATGMWTATGSMATGRFYHTATLLPNGKVLVAGGTHGDPVASAELYNPATGTWAKTGSMVTARFQHTATLLPNGQVLVAGGVTANSSGFLASAELYDPATGKWTATGSMATARILHTATFLPNGQVLVAGGTDGVGSFLTGAELYDPATGKWTATGNLKIERSEHTATLLPNGQVLVAGGKAIKDFSGMTSAELYDPANGTWKLTGSMPTGHAYHTATLLPNGKIMVAGGRGAAGLETPSAVLYDQATETWESTGSLATERTFHTATLLPNGQLLVAGGYNGTGELVSAELSDSANGTWATTGTLATARYIHTATLLPSGKVLVAGGQVSPAGSLASAEVYNPATGSWAVTGSMSAERTFHTATLLPSGKVLVAGGADFTGNSSSAELYDPASGSWTATGSMSSARFLHTATLLPNGKVLVAGGDGDSGVLASSELYDSATGSWMATGSLIEARAVQTATLLPNGKVLVAGGRGGNALSSAELYDPLTGSWAATANMSTARVAQTATLLPNGKVLVVGGDDSSTSPLRSAELFNPASGSWTVTASLTDGRDSHTATLLLDGRMLVAGGFDGAGQLASTELYDVGLGFQSAWQPQIASTLENSIVLTVTGSLFQGVSQASSGTTQDSSSNYPLVQLRSLVNEQIAFLSVDPVAGWSDTGFTSGPISGFPPGPTLVTVFTNGIPSAAHYMVFLGLSELANNSTRLSVGSGDKVGVSGFIIRGTVPRTVLVRALGPSLNVGGVPLTGRLDDPMVQLFGAQQQSLAQNDNWQSDQADEITATGLAPTDPREAAILMELPPGAYTAVISGVGNTTGGALVEVYALLSTPDADLGNISTRGPVGTGDGVLIGGVIVSGGVPAQVLFRAMGPSLTNLGVAGALQDPTLDLYDPNGALLQSNDNWQDTQGAQITATGLAPTDARESAILVTLSDGAYTAIVCGKDGTTGIALVEGYHLPSSPASVTR